MPQEMGMMRLARMVLCGVLGMFLAAGTCMAQAEMNPPFGLNWGDSPEKLVAWATRQSLDLNIMQPGDQPELRILKIQPSKGFLPEHKASALEARFLNGRLYELTVHYFDPDASADLMEARFEEMRRELTARHGALTANQQERSVVDKFATRKISFHREPVKGMMLLLVFTEVEDLLRQSKEARFSLVYRNDNLRLELSKEPAAAKEEDVGKD
jgi:hypothetical protein